MSVPCSKSPNHFPSNTPYEGPQDSTCSGPHLPLRFHPHPHPTLQSVIVLLSFQYAQLILASGPLLLCTWNIFFSDFPIADSFSLLRILLRYYLLNRSVLCVIALYLSHTIFPYTALFF